MQKITTQKEYNEVKHRVEALINEATKKGMLESGMNNDYTRNIAELSRTMADYENDYLELNVLKYER